MVACIFSATAALAAFGPATRAPSPRMSADSAHDSRKGVLPASNFRKASWLPGAAAPSYLDGSLAGDIGFDPMCMVALARTGARVDQGSWLSVDRPARMVMANEYERKKKVMWMREAEIKHARLAMMAAAGWPLAELLDKPLSKVLGQPYLLEATSGRAPSLFNGHLFEGPQGIFVGLVTLATAVLELNTLDHVEGLMPSTYVPGDLGFDPLGMAGQTEKEQKKMQLAEIKNGRTAMLAVTGFAVQEFLYGKPVIEQTPQFFKPFFL